MVKESGYGFITDPDAKREVTEVPTYRCVHCGKHWLEIKGSGIKRGYCMNCKGLICGPNCLSCIPNEQFIEILEQGLHPFDIDVNSLPQTVNVPRFWTP